ncbi:MAG: amino acid adenylation domain-containing protein, partial [Chitinophagaceae bacterium]|nr:amino acid adenylation domain-containing protein [Chitinophagaceae bacterium]
IFSTPSLGGQGELIRRSVQVSYEGIKAVADQAHYPLSYAQRRLWVLDKLNDNMTAYSRPIAYTINGELNKKALGEAIFTMIARHEILRTVFREVEGEPRQHILSLEELGFAFEYEDLQKEPDIASALQLSISNLASFTYKFETGPLFRIRLLQTAANKFELLLGIHHIISDEWSMQVMVKELVTLYNAYSKGEENPLLPLNIQYRDYAAWQHNLLEGENAANHKEYWLSKLGGELPVLDFPAEGARPAVQSFNGEQLPVLFSGKEIDELNNLCKSCGATLFMGLTALVKALLYRYTGQNDIIIGTPVAGRDHTDLEEQIGFYVNTLALRTKLDGDKGFTTLLNEVKITILEALDHQVYPFDRLVDELDLPRDMSRTPIFDVSVVLQNNRVQTVDSESMDDLDIAQSRVNVTTSLYDITFWFAEQHEGMLLNLEYNNDIYSRERMMKVAEHFKQLFACTLGNPSKPICSLDYLNNEERSKIMEFSSNNKPRSYSADTLVSLFESQVIKSPEADALVFEEKKFSFKELNEAANRVAHYLKNECGAGPGEKIGLLMDRSEWLLPGLVGILKSGAAFVPIDPSYPGERIKHIFKDAGITILVTDKDTYVDEYVCIHPGDPKLNQYNENNPPHNISFADLAYVIYTSGSTGRPKGVMIEHSSVVNYLQWANDFYFNNESGYGFAVYTSLSFDLTITSLLSGLYRGDCAWIFGNESMDTILRQIFCHHKLRAVKLTPSHIGLLGKMEITTTACNITHTIVGGETLTAYHVGVLREFNPHIRIYNEYGPTETTVGCTVKEVEESLFITIGKPITNTTAYILNDAGSLQPVGIFGELCIGGAGVARGYLNEENLTKKKFVSGFFEADRLYRTGDRARWRTDGELEFQGRLDNQVKLRGYRIEPGEIEAMMLGYEGLKESIVVPLQAGSEMLLAGYFTAEDKIDIENFRKYLNIHLPEYMVPAFLHQLAGFPLNTNGKVDRDKLPVVIHEEVETYQPPANNIEAVLAGIYGEVLNKEKVSVTGHFFRLGGHSLKAIQVVTRIYKALSVKIELRDIFTYPVIKDLAVFISNANADKYEAIPHIPDSEYYALSYAQRRLWVLDQFEGISLAYNMSE